MNNHLTPFISSFCYLPVSMPGVATVTLCKGLCMELKRIPVLICLENSEKAIICPVNTTMRKFRGLERWLRG